MTKWDRVTRSLAIVPAAAPFVFAAVRFLQTSSDRRPLWMAIVAFLSASGVLAFVSLRVNRRTILCGLTLVLATLMAAGTAFLFGASAAPGVWAVSCGFGFFDAVYVWLRTRMQPRRPVSVPGETSHRARAGLLAASELALILPALFFLAAVVVRYVPSVTDPAQRVVMWYATRLWTLWVLLIGLPFAALITGCATLLARGAAHRQPTSFSMATGVCVTRIIAVETFTAGVILTVVLLHMLAN